MSTTVARRKVAPVTVINGPLTKDEAADLTFRIRTHVSNLWQLVTEAHDRKAWQAMGYGSWKTYVEAELHMSESRSYQLIDAGHVIRVAQQVLADASNTLEVSPTAREAARAKDHLPALRRALRAKVKKGLEPQAALKEAIAELPAPKRSTTALPSQRKAQEDAPEPAPEKEAPVVAVKSRKPRRPKGTHECPRCGGLGYI